MADFLHMGGYAFYVWLSYGIVVAVLGYHFIAPAIRLRQLKAEIAARQSTGETER